MSNLSGSIRLGKTTYGKAKVRLVKVERSTSRHELHDLNVDVALDGDFAAAFTGSDNTQLLATDTMRNTVYALAQQHPLEQIEDFGVALVRHFLNAGPTVSEATITITEYPWSRIPAGGTDHDHAFVRGAGERTAVIHGTAEGIRIQSGIDNVLVLKTTNSGWEKFYREQYTSLPDATDRILATSITAEWQYSATELPFNDLWNGIRATILETFTDHYSPSVQNTIYRMGKAVLEAFPAVASIHFTLPNKHHLLYDLARFGLANDNQIFHVTSDPYGLIEGTIERGEA